jgi:hypothetical protein
LVPYILKGRGVFIFKDQAVQEELPFFLDHLILEDKGIVCERLGITNPVTLLDTPEDLNSPHNGCENLKPMRSSLVLNLKKMLGINSLIYDFSSTLLFTGGFCGPYCTSFIGKGL